MAISRKSTGFTLIELIVVIVILGVISSTAIVKFVSMASEARTATIENIAAQMHSAAKMVYMKAIIDGEEQSAWNTDYVVAGETIILRYGYPTNRDIANLLDYSLTAGLELRVSGILNREFRYANVDNPNSCRVVYSHPVALGSGPVISTTVSGC